MITKKSKIFLAGHNGMIGSAIHKILKKKNYKNIITVDKKYLDLKNQDRTFKFLKKIKPDATIIAAAKVGGISVNNKKKAEFIYDNLSIQNNLIHGSYLSGTKNLIFLGSSCVYPKNSNIPIKENDLLSNYLEKTNEPYAIAKIAGIKLCESYNYQYNLNYKCLMPANSYGVNDNYDKNTSHFLPALIRKIIYAKKNNKKSITLWGTGKPKRELVFSEDLAYATIYFLNKRTKETLINIGTNVEKSIEDYAKYLMKLMDIKLSIRYIKRNLDGTFEKKLDTSLASRYGWNAKTSLSKGLMIAIKDFKSRKIT